MKLLIQGPHREAQSGPLGGPKLGKNYVFPTEGKKNQNFSHCFLRYDLVCFEQGFIGVFHPRVSSQMFNLTRLANSMFF